MLAKFIPEIRSVRIVALCLGLTAIQSPTASAQAPALAKTDWPQFRGPGALGRSDASGVPTTWTDESNIVWKAALPGPGASSPIVLGNRVFLTCFTGYKASASEPG